jgi:hypothetical protein
VDHATLDYLTRVVRDLARRGVRPFILYPPAAHEDGEANAMKASLHVMDDLAQKLSTHGLPMLGSPEQSWVSASILFDTPYHLNCAGRRARTLTVISNLRTALGGAWP